MGDAENAARESRQHQSNASLGDNIPVNNYMKFLAAGGQITLSEWEALDIEEREALYTAGLETFKDRITVIAMLLYSPEEFLNVIQQ